MLTPDQKALMTSIARMGASEKSAVQYLGAFIGFGRMMQLAQECWRDTNLAHGHAGGEFVSGPCAAMTVPCGCVALEARGSCDWCCGAGWLTKKVKAQQDLAAGIEPLIPPTREEPLEVRYGKGKTEYGPGVDVLLSAVNVVEAIEYWLIAQSVQISGARTVRVNGERIREGRIYADPSGSVTHHGKLFSGRGPEKA